MTTTTRHTTSAVAGSVPTGARGPESVTVEKPGAWGSAVRAAASSNRPSRFQAASHRARLLYHAMLRMLLRVLLLRQQLMLCL